MVGARVRRQQVAYAVERGLSSRRACALLSVARSTLGYASRLDARDAAPVAAMREFAGQYPRYGYRRIQIFLKRVGHPMSRFATGFQRGADHAVARLMRVIGARFVSVLESDTDPGRHYTGVTSDVDNRLEWHNHGPSGYTLNGGRAEPTLGQRHDRVRDRGWRQAVSRCHSRPLLAVCRGVGPQP